MHANTFAARAGRWSAQHRKKAIWGWIAFVAISLAIGSAVGVKSPTEYIGPGESGRADRLANDHFPKDAEESVLIEAAKGGSARDASVRKAVDDTITAVSAQRGVTSVESPYAKGNEGLISRDGSAALVTFNIRGDETQSEKAVGPVVDAIHRVEAQNPGVFVGQFGEASANKALSKAFEDDFKKAETLSLPITLADPRRRLRRARGRRHPAAARPDRGDGHARPRRPAQPDRADGRHDRLDHPAHRPGRGRRLHAVLRAS